MTDSPPALHCRRARPDVVGAQPRLQNGEVSDGNALIVDADFNLDYPPVWLRDLSRTTRALWIAACPDEPGRLFDWFVNAAGRVGPNGFRSCTASAESGTAPRLRSIISPAIATANRCAWERRLDPMGGSACAVRCSTPRTSFLPAGRPGRARQGAGGSPGLPVVHAALTRHQQGDAMTTTRLEGKVALITGSDSGIGQVTAIAFANEGADVIVNYLHDADGAAATAAAFEAACQNAIRHLRRGARRGDVRPGRRPVRYHRHPVEQRRCLRPRSGRPVHRGVGQAIRTNLYGAFLCCRRFIQLCKHAGGGSGKIINVSSVRADISNAEGADYDCSQGAIRMLTRTLALELAPLKINVNSLAPGMVLTPFNQPAIDDPDLLKEQVQSIPCKQAADPSEIPRLAVLASSDAACVTGSTDTMGGGLSRNLGQGALPFSR